MLPAPLQVPASPPVSATESVPLESMAVESVAVESEPDESVAVESEPDSETTVSLAESAPDDGDESELLQAVTAKIEKRKKEVRMLLSVAPQANEGSETKREATPWGFEATSENGESAATVRVRKGG